MGTILNAHLNNTTRLLAKATIEMANANSSDWKESRENYIQCAKDCLRDALEQLTYATLANSKDEES